MPRLFFWNPSFVILFLTIGLCASVFNMMIEYASTYAVSAVENKTSPLDEELAFGASASGI